MRWLVVLGICCIGARCSGEEDVCDSFGNWFMSLGGQADNVALGDFEYFGQGVLATKDVYEGDELMRLPLANVIYHDNLAKSSQGARLIAKELKLRPHSMIACFILLEKAKGDSSAWSLYMDLLPKKSYSGWSYSKEVLAELNDTRLEKKLFNLGQVVNSNWQEVAHDVLEEALKLDKVSLDTEFFSLDWFRYAHGLVESRALNVQGGLYLVPFADMFNYKSHPRPRRASNGDFFLQHHVLTDTDFIIKADRDTEAGEQVFMDYGDNSNEIYFTFHGFVPDYNPFACFELANSVPRKGFTDSYINLRDRLVTALHMPANPRECLRWNTINKVWAHSPVNMMGRILKMSDAQARECIEQVSNAKNRKSFGTAARKCLHAVESTTEELISRMKALEDSYKTTLEEDLEKLTKLEAPSTMEGEQKQITFRYRVAQKQLLRETLEFVQTGKMPEREKAAQTVLTIAEADEKLTENGRATKEELEQALKRPLEEKIEMLNAWVKDQKFPVQKIVAAAVPGLRVGTLATSPIKENEPYLVVPKRAVMDLHTSQKSDVYPYLHHISVNLDRSDDFHELLVFLMFEYFVKGPESTWWPYLALLPSSTEMYPPAFYDNEQLAILTGHPIRNEIVRNRDRILSTFGKVKTYLYRTLGEKFLPPDVFTKENYLWAHSILDSRSIWWNGQRHLVPLLDMVNCKTDGLRVHSTTVDLSLGGAVTRAAATYEKEEQVFEDYGQPNSIYFLFHGFSLENNPYDCVEYIADLDTEQLERFSLFKHGNPKHPDATQRVRFCIKSPLSSNEDLIVSFGVDDMARPKKALEKTHQTLVATLRGRTFEPESKFYGPFLFMKRQIQLLEDLISQFKDLK